MDAAARKVIVDGGYGPGFTYFSHRLGHGIGMDMHEWPYFVKNNMYGYDLQPHLQAGNLFSDEPGIYIRGEFGIRLEDDLLITESGAGVAYSAKPIPRRSVRRHGTLRGKRVTQNMNGARRDGLTFLFLGCIVFLLLGISLESIVPGPMSDFKAVYYGARCVLHHQDPYANGAILQSYLADGGTFPADPIIARSVRRAILVCINLPTGLFLVAPFALFPLGPSHLLWLTIMAASLIVAAFLMWNLGAERSPLLAGALIALLLVNSEVVMIIGNAAAIAIGLCVIATWCFLKNRFAVIGVACLAFSLLLKPHDAGLVWLYFLLAGGMYRKRALQTLAVVVVLAIPAVLWVSQVSRIGSRNCTPISPRPRRVAISMILVQHRWARTH